MKKSLWLLIIIGALAVGIYFGKDFLRGLWPAIQPPPADIGTIITPGNSGPLKLPSEFAIEIFARDLPGARVLTFDHFSNLWVSQTSENSISLIEIDKTTGRAVRQNPLFKNELAKPHGLAFDPQSPSTLYIAEEGKISRLPTYSDGGLEKVADLPAGGRHTTRTLSFGPDGRLYVSIGSSCNVCNEEDNRRATIQTVDLKTGALKEFARGLRNTVFFTWDESGRLWGTDMGRDMLGDDLPPDELNIIAEGKNYGWPTCYGKNIHDTEFDKNTYVRNPCMEPFEMGSTIDIPAHSAPLGIAFPPENNNWPSEYDGKIFIAYHGSWNRSVPTGYKIVVTDPKTGNLNDFITGWLTNGGEALGRPVDLKFGPDGNLYISDDKAGVIYRVSYVGN